MTKAVWTAFLSAAALCVSTSVFAQATDAATVNVSATVAAKAKLTIAGGPVSFPDADPTATPVISASALTIDVKARTSASGSVTLTALASDDLKTAGSDVITINNLTWTVSGAGFVAGTMSKSSAQSVGTWTGSGSPSGSQTLKLANSWSYATGSYSTTVTYTLTAP